MEVFNVAYTSNSHVNESRNKPTTCTDDPSVSSSEILNITGSMNSDFAYASAHQSMPYNSANSREQTDRQFHFSSAAGQHPPRHSLSAVPMVIFFTKHMT